MSDLVEKIHSEAVEACLRYKKSETDLIDVLQRVEEHKVYLKRGCSSLFSYCVKDLGLAESVAYNLISVARKAREVPELKTSLEAGAMTLSNARRIVPVLTAENKSEWIKKAATLSNRQLEREIVRVRPEAAAPERASYTSPERVKLQLGLSESQMLKLRRVQDLLCQSKSRVVNLEEVISVVVGEFLRRNDPVEKAKRHHVRNAPVVAEGNCNKDPGRSARPTENSDQLLVPPESVTAPVLAPSAPVEAPGAEVRSHRKPRSMEADRSKHRQLTRQGSGTNGSASGAIGKSPMVPVPGSIPADPAADNAGGIAPDSELVTLRVGQRRLPIPRAVIHQVNLRDRRRCAYELADGTRCNQSRWVEIHHMIPVSQGGGNSAENLITLCSAHHKFVHLKVPPAGLLNRTRA